MVNKALIKDFVEDLFNQLTLDLLGPEYLSRAFVFKIKDTQYDPSTTLDNQFIQAATINDVDENFEKYLDDPVLKTIKDSTQQTLNNLKEKTITDITRAISDSELELASKMKQDPNYDPDIKDIFAIAKPKIEEIQDKLESQIKTIINNELYVAQNYGAYSGIIEAAKSVGLDDPTVFKIGVLDSKRCKHCWRLWTLRDGVTPKVYKLSELSATAGHHSNPEPSIAPTHPNCRDVLVTLMPGFGFDSSGRIIYKGIDPRSGELWDEYAYQRGKQ